MPEPILDEQARKAVHAARDAAQAVEIVRQLQADEASLKANENMAAVVRHEMINVLSQGTEKERAVLLARVPYICQEIKDFKDFNKDINVSLNKIQETIVYIPLLQKLVFGMVGIVLTSIMGGIMMLLLR